MDRVIVCGVLAVVLFCRLGSAEDTECKRERYRSITGHCNNLDHETWGEADTLYRRLLKPDYEDGKSHPREDLPNARIVSTQVVGDADRPSALLTFMTVSTGQLIAHDVTLTKEGEADCGPDDCSNEGECYPIRIPRDDPDYKDQICLPFIRSVGKESFNARAQTNELSSYLDAGFMYGDSIFKLNTLRDGNLNRGQMKTIPHPIYGGQFNPLLPQTYDKDCENTTATIQCFRAGDKRANENAGLASLHTIFVREHNNIEAYLYEMNPHWHGETLFQETRRIVIAMWQNIVYNEYLPKVLGVHNVKKYNLELQKGDHYFHGYDSDRDAGILTAFATAAFRFGHSQISDFFVFMNKYYNKKEVIPFSKVISRPHPLYAVCPKFGTGVDAIMRGLAAHSAQNVDLNVVEQIKSHLFAKNPPFGLGEDLISRNIQRGRDHGLPGYTKFVKLCSGVDIESFHDLEHFMPKRYIKRISYVYQRVEDIDLFVGGISEHPVKDGTVGPTFSCIIGEQFRNLREGDRFWFENKDKIHGFTPDQLREIKKVTLAHLICENGDDIGTIQPQAMLKPLNEVPLKYRYQYSAQIEDWYTEGNNERVHCSQIPKPDLSYWREHGEGDPDTEKRQLKFCHSDPSSSDDSYYSDASSSPSDSSYYG